ncbi:MAG TPA: formylglycine-generating enzyme family protein [Phycisphaerae bacterium]|nr:formylglycine-generating enzyme family protein [Phycisphaerae bacterium]
MDREAWFPAARELGRKAAANPGLRDRIWAEAGVNSLGMKFVRIEPGEFVMGPPYQALLWPREAHRVRLTRPFYICVTETTNEQYAVLRPDRKAESRFSPDPESPVVDLSWDDVQAFCRDLSYREGAVYRLPTEAEWEYVCRAGMPSPHLFCFGDDFSILPEYAWCGGRRSSAAPVALLKANAWGVYDMHGNALELVQDWFSTDFNGAKADAVAVDPEGPSHSFNHTLRGGEWCSPDVRYCECAARMPWPLLELRLYRDVPLGRERIGFRIVRDCETATTQNAPQAGKTHEQTR